MERISFDTGLRTYQVNDHATLTFNPTDPNTYNRFFNIKDDVDALEAEYTAKMEDSPDGEEAVRILAEFDDRIKALLTSVFGERNDFNAIFEGTNVMAVANGERVITNFFKAIAPIMEVGVEEHTQEKVDAAKQNREQRRAGR